MPLTAAIRTVLDLLKRLARLEDFWTVMGMAFGCSDDRQQAELLRSDWLRGDAALLPRIEVVDADGLCSAQGAYAESTHTIYLADSFVSRATSAQLTQVLLEEYGHSIDTRIKATDSAGDEGAIFAAITIGASPDHANLQALQAEQDHGWIRIEGKAIAAEFSVDTTAPSLQGGVLALTPGAAEPAQSSRADIRSDLKIRFSEAIQRGSSGSINLYRANGSLLESFSVASSNRLSFAGDSITINPSWDLDGSSNYYFTIDSGSIVDLAGNPFAGSSSSTALNVSSDVEIRNVYGSTFMRDEYPGTASESIGDHRVLYMRATFTDLNRSPNSLEDARADMLGTAQGYMVASRGAITVTTTYTPLITLPFSYEWLRKYDSASGQDGLAFLQAAAQAEARRLGFEPSDFNLRALRLDVELRSGASWGGGDSAWLAWGGSSVILHEAGHALGMGHAQSINWDGNVSEYGNYIDWMGYGEKAYAVFGSVYQKQQGWLDAGDLEESPGPGIYRLHAIDSGRQVVGQRYALRQTISSDALNTKLSNTTAPIYTLEYRPRQGGALRDAVVLLRDNRIIDLTPATSSQQDAGIRLGQTYQIPGSDSRFSVVSLGDDYIDVAYEQGPFSGNVAPSITLKASATTVKRFDTATFTADAFDANGDALLYRWEFSDGVSAAGKTFTRSFNQATAQTITVTLSVSDRRGGVSTLSRPLTVGAASTGTAATIGSLSSISLSKPRVALVASNGFAAEGGESGSLLITRIGSSLEAALVVKLNYSGSGQAEFASLPSSVTIEAGQASTLLTLTPSDDSTIEARKSLLASLVADAAYEISSQNSSARIFCADNDTPVVSIEAVDASASEPGSSGRDTGLFLIRRTGPTTTAMTVYYGITGTAYNGGDYGRLDGQVVIPSGQTSVTVMVNPLDDELGEQAETVTLSLASFADAYSVGQASSATVTIRDPGDLPTVSLRATSASAVEGEAAKASFTALGNGSSPLTISYSISGTASNGVDVQKLSGSITIPAGTDQRSVDLPIQTLVDSANENDESLIITINRSAAYRVGMDSSAQIRIADPINLSASEDRVRVSRYFSTTNGGTALADPSEDGARPAEFYVYRENTTNKKQALQVSFSLSGSATPNLDYTGIVLNEAATQTGTFTPAANNSVTIPANANGVIIRLVPLADTSMEGSETITFKLESVSGSKAFYPLGINREVSVNLQDQQSGTVQVGFAAASTLVGESLDPAGNLRSIQVTLNQASTAPVSVRYRASGGSALGLGSDWTFLDPSQGNAETMNGILSFAPGETSKSISFRVQADCIPENQESFGIVLENPSGASLKAGASSHTVTLYDVIPDGLIKEERWDGGSIYTNNSWDSQPASYTGYLSGLTTAQNVGNDYSRRLTGLITAPSSGAYTFYLAADDQARLYLSSNDNATNKALIASVSSWTDFQQWEKNSSQKSAVINLVAGQRYAVEVQQREASGGDHLAVGWTAPGNSSITPILTAASILPNGDNRTLRFLSDRSTLVEGTSGQLLVCLDRPNPNGSVTVDLEVVSGGSASLGSDFALGSTTLTFAPGELTQAIDLSALSDSVNEAAEQLSLRLVNASGAQISNPGRHQLTILDANAPVISAQTGIVQASDTSGALIVQANARLANGRSLQSWEILSGNARVEGDATAALAIDDQGRITLANPNALPLGSYELALTLRATDSLGCSSLGTARVAVGGRRLVEERWNDNGAAYDSNNWTMPPDVTTLLTAMDAGMDVADHYSRRITGVFRVATTGDYSFWVAASDVGRLTLAPWADPSNEQELVSTGEAAYQAWNTSDSQQSPPQTLIAGQRYVLRAYQKEEYWGDHLSVAWAGPGLSRRLMTAADFLPAQPSLRLAAGVADAASPAAVAVYSLAATALTDTGLTSSIAAGGFSRDSSLGLSGTAVADASVILYDGTAAVAQTQASASGSWSITTPTLADGDHTFRAEIVDPYGNIAVTHPATFTIRSQISVGAAALVSRAVAGNATTTGSQGIGNVRNVSGLNQGVVAYDIPITDPFEEQRWSDAAVYTNNSWDSVAASSRSWLSTLVTPQNVADNYARRIRGSIIAPQTGSYTFYLASDDDARLYLSSDDSAANKNQIASVTGWTDFQQWNKYSTQRSTSIALQAGQKYYLEVQQQDTGGGDHVCVGWTGPGISSITPIALASNLLVADATAGSVQVVNRSLADAATAGSTSFSPAGFSKNGRYIILATRQPSSFGDGGSAFQDSHSNPAAAASDLLIYDRSNSSLRLITSRDTPTRTSSKQAELIGITSDNRYAVYSTDNVELIAGFSAPGKPPAVWSLVEGGYPSSSGSSKGTAVRVADLDLSKISLRLTGAALANKDQLGVIRIDTIQSSTGSVKFWAETSLDTLKKAVQLEISDTSAGLMVKALQAKTTELSISAGSLNNQATINPSGSVGQTFTTGSLGSSNLLRSISIDGPSNNATTTSYRLKVWENNGDFTTFSPGALVATSTNALAFTNNSSTIFQFDAVPLSSDKVYLFSLSSGSTDHVSFRAGVTNAGLLSNGQLFSNLANPSSWDLGFSIKLEPAANAPGSFDGESQGSSLAIATSATGAGIAVSSLGLEGANLSSLMFDEVGQSAARDIVAYDLASGQQQLLSHSAASGNLQSQAANVSHVSLSSDGRFVLFTANDASKLGNGGTAFSDSSPAVADLFATQLQTGQIRLLSHAATNLNASAGAAVTLRGTSADGDYAVFSVDNATAFGFVDSATSSSDLVAVNLNDGSFRLISRAASSSPATSSAQAVSFELITDRYVYFSANDATKFGFSSDGNTSNADLFRFNLSSGALDLVSHATSSSNQALAGTYQSGSLTVSPDGRYAAFAVQLATAGGGFTVASGVQGTALLLADLQTGAIRMLNSSDREGTNLSYGAWGSIQYKPRFFTPDSKALVWQASYLGWVASDISSYGAGGHSSTTQAVLITDLSTDLPAAGVATTTRILSHTAVSTTQAAPTASLLGVSEDSRLAFFSAADATGFGNGGVAFSDAARTAPDLFAVDLTSRSIELISGQDRASFGQAASFLGLGEGGSVLYSLGNGAGISTVAGSISDPNGSGSDLLAARFNLIDLDTADDTLNADGSGTTRDNITAKRSFVLHSWATPGMAVQLRDGDSVIASQTALSDGRLRWELSNVAVGSHSYNLWFAEEGIPIRLASSLGSSSLTVTVTGNNSPIGVVTISGTLVLGRTLTATNTLADFDGIPSSGADAIRYQWLADGSLIAGATGSTYVLTAAEVGKAISVIASYKDNQGTSESVSSQPTQVVVASSPVVITDITDDFGLFKGSIVAGGFTNDTTPTLVGTLASALPTGASVRVFRNDAFAGNATVNGTDWTYTPAAALTAGSHSFQVAIFSSSGIAGVFSDPRMIVLDTSAPTQTLTITGVSDDRDPVQGLIAAGGRTNDTTPTVSGTLSAALAAGETVQLYNGNTAMATAVVDNTALSWTASLNLSSNATYAITARVEDGAGNQGPLSASRAFTLDTLAPTQTLKITAASDNVGPLLGPIADGGSSNDTTPTLGGTLSAALASGELVAIYSNGSNMGNASVSGTNWTFTPTTPLSSNGSHAFTAAVLDGAGNSGAVSAARTLQLDTSAPIQTLMINDVIDDRDPRQGSVAAGGRTNDTTPTVSGTLSAALAAGETVQLYNGNTAMATAVVDNTALSWTASLNLSSNATYAITARVEDGAGNQGPLSASRAFTLDTLAPSWKVTISDVIDDRDPRLGSVAAGGRSNDTTPTFSGTLPAALAEGETVRLYNGATALATAEVNNTARTWTAELNLSNDATYTITARVEDGAGHQGPLSSSRVFSLDTEAPSKTVTITTIHDNVGSEQGPVSEGGSSNDTTPALGGTLSAALASGELVAIYSNGSNMGNASVSGTNWTFTPTTPLSSNGSHAFTAAVLDGAGNRGSLSAARTIVLDAPISSEAQDTLTGTTAADIFLLPQLSRSLLGSTGGFTYDTITGFQASDSIQVGALTYKLKLTSSAGVAAGLSTSQLSGVLPPSFAANSARAFTVTGLNGTFVALNDNQAGFQATQDAVLFLASYSISSINSVSVV